MKRLRLPALVLPALVAACSDPAPPAGPFWAPGTVHPSARPVNGRGLVDLRGIIHLHSVYSGDACDGKPVVDGVRDPVCFEDLRRGMCQVRHDFFFLTDHTGSFADTEYPEVMLHRPERGDTLVERNGRAVANRAACPDGQRQLLIPGVEAKSMPVGLEEHVAATPAARRDLYGATSDEALDAMRAKGAVVIMMHPEGWSIDELAAMKIDGFEMYNLHTNTMWRADKALELLGRLYAKDPGLPHPDLALLPIFEEDPRYLERWGSLLARGQRRVTTMATDAHRNSFPTPMQDGERVDSFRRMMQWFSNHLLVKTEADGSWDDRHLKHALREGRLYGAFEVLGFPAGFEFRADSAAGVTELGGEVSLAQAPVLHVKKPAIEKLDPARAKPAIRVRLLKAIEKGFEEVASSEGDLAWTPAAPGAYRAEVRMVPHHLRQDLGDDADSVLERELVWIYANAIHVRP